MEKISDKIKDFLESNKLTIEKFSEGVQLDVAVIQKIINDTYKPSEEELSKINNFISSYKSSFSRRSIKALELVFKFGACLMAIVTLLLCIMGNVKPETLIALLSIGLVCSTITSLPKIDK
ncbi:MAG: helix-turn-helix transcriptional regulator [Clostridiales bacterium]|nr:helix-turn-helix transcriptional regulator [Clostridiales bacterium]